ncbi:hypothetical protein VTH8203_01580 [Vibrio thalassae]|uniref:Uncharacterized protein n=1 Tax=Vibrio thalassae TaxID=1243014 RepID=A0A240EJ20_9VIBR|nr:hypothetical protein [Vibrio thalassae]SNX47965.1 hypothetical protein VTH8203_01580 [Vibrio thalassae]
MKKILLMILASLMASQSYAVDCGPVEIKAIQSQKEDVLVLIKGNGLEAWKSLGLHSQQSTSSFQSIAQQALATRVSVILRFPDGENCGETDYSTSAQAIRIYGY